MAALQDLKLTGKLLRGGVGMVVAALLASCASVSERIDGVTYPFQPAEKQDLQLAQMSLPDQVVITPINGAPAPYDQMLARAVVRAAGQREIIASTASPGQPTTRMTGSASFIQSPEGPLLKMRWMVAAPNGGNQFAFTIVDAVAPDPSSADQWKALEDRQVIDRLAGLTADELASWFKRSATALAAIDPSADQPDLAAQQARAAFPSQASAVQANSGQAASGQAASGQAASGQAPLTSPPSLTPGGSPTPLAGASTPNGAPAPEAQTASAASIAPPSSATQGPSVPAGLPSQAQPALSSAQAAPAGPEPAAPQPAAIASAPPPAANSPAANAPAATPAAVAPSAPEIYFLPVLGAPGDGRQALATAFRQTLGTRGVRLAAAPGPRTLIVQSVVTISDAEPGLDRVQIDWDIKSPRGDVIGSINQDNKIQQGRLDGTWGPLAFDIADPIAAEVAGFLSQIQ